MKKSKISAGIVTYNNEKEIVPCLSSLIRYTEGLNIEIYVQDNGSQDDTIEIVKNQSV